MDNMASSPQGFSNPVVFFDISLGGESMALFQPRRILKENTGERLGRVKMELFANITPRTAENFRQFCTGESKDSQGRSQGYKNSKFHRVVCAHTYRMAY